MIQGSERQSAPVLMDVCENCGRLRGQYGVLVMCPERESGVHAYTVAVEVVPRSVAEAAELLALRLYDLMRDDDADCMTEDDTEFILRLRDAHPRETPCDKCGWSAPTVYVPEYGAHFCEACAADPQAAYPKETP